MSRQTWVLLFVSLAGTWARAPTPTAAEHFAVRFVLDGDTIDLAGRGRVRLLGIDAPEVGFGFDTPQAFAEESRAFMASLVLHRFVHLELDGDGRDKYGRQLAYVIRDDAVFINAEMLRAGLARVSARVRLRRLPELQRAEASAQQARRGMWGARPAIPSRRRAMFDSGRHARDSAFQLCAPRRRELLRRRSGWLVPRPWN